MHEPVALVDEEEILEGLLILTNQNLGVSRQLLDKIKVRTARAVKQKLAEIKDNLPREIKNAKSRGQYRAVQNAKKSGRYPEWFSNTSLHHIVAWGDMRAVAALVILIKYDIDPHHYANTILMPKSLRFLPHPNMPNAPAHTKIHTDKYFFNVQMRLLAVDLPGATQHEIINALIAIGEDLQSGIFPY